MCQLKGVCVLHTSSCSASRGFPHRHTSTMWTRSGDNIGSDQSFHTLLAFSGDRTLLKLLPGRFERLTLDLHQDPSRDPSFEAQSFEAHASKLNNDVRSYKAVFKDAVRAAIR
jgi:hypothetical protein